MTIREFKKSDIEGLLPLMIETNAFHASNRPDIKQESVNPAPILEHLHKLLADVGHVLLVAEVNDRIIGFVGGSIVKIINHPVMADRIFGYIGDMVVAQQYRRKGIGKQLIVEIERRLKAKGAMSTELSVYAFNDIALQFYRQLGYKPKTLRLEKQ